MFTLIQNARDVIALVLLFGVTIFVHELGHFLLALRCGLVIETFSIGFGPAIWKREWRGITFKIGWFPIGGYVALPQLDPAAMDAVQGKQKDDAEADTERKTYPEIAPWKKILVALFGPIGNVILAVILAWAVYLAPDPGISGSGDAIVGYVEEGSVAAELGVRMGTRITSVNGTPVESWYDYNVESLLGAGSSDTVRLGLVDASGTREVDVPLEDSGMGLTLPAGIQQALPATIGKVRRDSPAERAGVLKGDEVKSLDGTAIIGWQHFAKRVRTKGGRNVEIIVDRDGEEVHLQVSPEFDAVEQASIIGVSPGHVAAMEWMRYRKPYDQLRNDASAILRILKALVTPKESGQAARALGGPVAIFVTLWASIKISWLSAVGFLRFLNVNLAVLNLLPIPVLDGGHIVFALWEWITRRKVHAKVVNVLVNAFAVLLIVALLALTFRDVRRFVPGIPFISRSADPVAEELVEPAEPEAP